jgi:hypothetical protein
LDDRRFLKSIVTRLDPAPISPPGDDLEPLSDPPTPKWLAHGDSPR